MPYSVHSICAMPVIFFPYEANISYFDICNFWNLLSKLLLTDILFTSTVSFRVRAWDALQSPDKANAFSGWYPQSSRRHTPLYVTFFKCHGCTINCGRDQDPRSRVLHCLLRTADSSQRQSVVISFTASFSVWQDGCDDVGAAVVNGNWHVAAAAAVNTVITDVAPCPLGSTQCRVCAVSYTHLDVYKRQL